MAGLQTITTPVTGTAISSTTFGVPVANNCGVLANPPIAKMRNSTTQSITNATDTALTWDTEDFDTAAGHSTSVNTSRYTCPTGYPGRYSVRTCVSYAANATGFRFAWFAVNGTAVAGSQEIVAGVTGNAITVASETIVTLVVGDYVEAFTRQSSGGALSTNNPGGSDKSQSWFEVQWISQ